MGYVNFDKKRLLNIHHVNDEGIIILIFDEREKPFSNIRRIVDGRDKFVKLTEEDTIIFASPQYAGLEKTSTKLYDDISKIGLNLVILDKNYLSHHASSEDLMMMINLMNPKYYFPVIGEYRHLISNANLALNMGYRPDQIVILDNGQIATFNNKVLKKVA